MDEEQQWDLSGLLDETSIEGLKRDFDKYLEVLKGVIGNLQKNQSEITEDVLVKHLHEFENAAAELYDIAGYSVCRYASNTSVEGSQQLMSIYTRFLSQREGLLRSIFKTIGNIIDKRPSIIGAQDLVEYRHLFEKATKSLPHILSPVEEELIIEKDTNGVSAIYELYESWVGSKMLDVKIEGEEKSVSANHAFSLFMAGERETRKSAYEVYFGSFVEDKLLYGTALRTVCSDHVNMTKRRKWPSYMTQSFIDQDVDDASINTLLDTLETQSASLQNYIKLKADHFGQKRLPSYDILAPWLPKQVWNKNWSEVKSSVIKAYRSFDDEIGDFVSELFDNHQVDYVDRPGRVNLKFCYPSFKKKTAFVFFTYTGIMNDAYVAAHEIGHAVHSYFTDTNQRLLNRDYSSCIAETGSIFGELLLTEQLVKDCDTNELRIEILAKVLDRFYQLAFHTGIWALFERDVYEFIESGGYLDADKACEIWRENRHKLYGDNVDWVKNSEYEWPTWGQLFRPNFRFYNYTYCFAQMVVYALYNDFKRGESDFNERFKTLLSRGGSMSPREQLAELGYDITRPGFWQLGIKQADTFLDDLRRLI